MMATALFFAVSEQRGNFSTERQKHKVRLNMEILSSPLYSVLPLFPVSVSPVPTFHPLAFVSAELKKKQKKSLKGDTESPAVLFGGQMQSSCSQSGHFTLLPQLHPSLTLHLSHTHTPNNTMWYGPAPAPANFITHDWMRTTWRLSRQMGISCACVCSVHDCGGWGSSPRNLNHLKTLQAYYVWLLYTCESPRIQFEVKTPELVTVCSISTWNRYSAAGLLYIQGYVMFMYAIFVYTTALWHGSIRSQWCIIKMS